MPVVGEGRCFLSSHQINRETAPAPRAVQAPMNTSGSAVRAHCFQFVELVMCGAWPSGMESVNSMAEYLFGFADKGARREGVRDLKLAGRVAGLPFAAFIRNECVSFRPAVRATGLAFYWAYYVYASIYSHEVGACVHLGSAGGDAHTDLDARIPRHRHFS